MHLRILEYTHNLYSTSVVCTCNHAYILRVHASTCIFYARTITCDTYMIPACILRACALMCVYIFIFVYMYTPRHTFMHTFTFSLSPSLSLSLPPLRPSLTHTQTHTHTHIHTHTHKGLELGEEAARGVTSSRQGRAMSSRDPFELRIGSHIYMYICTDIQAARGATISSDEFAQPIRASHW